MTKKPSDITITDQFCGAGGSSIGATAAGARLHLALNHWQLAIETHNTNFPNAHHDCTEISACDPRKYPSTDILITSPECTNHTLAKGRPRKWQQQLDLFGKITIDPAEERSRATMWDVPRFAEYHRYNIIIVENVVEARMWAPWEGWLHAMRCLGYAHQCVYLNSMHVHPTPQSRDRMYVVFHRAGNADFSRLLVTPRNKGGLMPSNLQQKDGYLWVANNRVICRTEQDFFNALGIPFVEPRERNEQTADRIKRGLRS